MFQRQTHRNKIQPKKKSLVHTKFSKSAPHEISQLNIRYDLSDPKHHIMNKKNVFSRPIYDSVCSCLFWSSGKHLQAKTVLLRQHPAFAPPGAGEWDALLSTYYAKCHIKKWSTPTEKSENKRVLVHYLASIWPSLHSFKYTWAPSTFGS